MIPNTLNGYTRLGFPALRAMQSWKATPEEGIALFEGYGVRVNFAPRAGSELND